MVRGAAPPDVDLLTEVEGSAAQQPTMPMMWPERDRCCQTVEMAAPDIDSYLADLDEPKQSTLEQLRRDILAAIPDAEQCISYAMPAFKVQRQDQSPASRRSRTT